MNKTMIYTLIGLVIVMGASMAVTFSSKNTITSNLPSNFIQVKRDIANGITYDLCSLTEDYYLQPSFYPSYQQFSGKSHDYSRWGVHGYGAYPGEIGYVVSGMKSGQSLNVCTFVHSSFEVETFQGVKLAVADIPSQFDVSFEPSSFLLYPAFPDPKRNDKWTYKVKMTVMAKQDIPQGNYNFQVVAGSPDNSIPFRDEMKQYSLDTYKCPWFGQCDSKIIELRKAVYEDAGQFGASNFFRFNLKAN